MAKIFVQVLPNICVSISNSKYLYGPSQIRRLPPKELIQYLPARLTNNERVVLYISSKKRKYSIFSVLPLQICCHCHLKSLSLHSFGESKKMWQMLALDAEAQEVWMVFQIYFQVINYLLPPLLSSALYVDERYASLQNWVIFPSGIFLIYLDIKKS